MSADGMRATVTTLPQTGARLRPVPRACRTILTTIAVPLEKRNSGILAQFPLERSFLPHHFLRELDGSELARAALDMPHVGRVAHVRQHVALVVRPTLELQRGGARWQGGNRRQHEKNICAPEHGRAFA